MNQNLSFIPNSITALRLILTAWFLWLLIGGMLENFTVPAAAPYLLFASICLSDLLDGAVARRLKAESVFGGILDVSADSLFIFSSLAVFNYFKVVPVWFTVFVLADFLIFLTTSKFLIPANREGFRRVLVFDIPGRIAAVLFYLIPMAAWASYRFPGRQSLFTFNALLYLSVLFAAVSISERLFLCFTRSRRENGHKPPDD